MLSMSIPSFAGGMASLRVAPFSGTIVYRQTFVRNVRRLWTPSRAPLRWSAGFNAVYTSLDLAVALAERVKRTGATRVEIVVGIARVQIRRVVTLDDEAMSALGTSREEVTAEDYSLPQRLGRALFEQGAGAIAVPAAIARVAEWFPEMRVERGLSTLTVATPRFGTNLVIFPDNRDRSDSRREVERYTCLLQGIAAGNGHEQI